MLDIAVKHPARPSITSPLLDFRGVRTIIEIRRENLETLLAEAKGSQTELGRRIGKSNKQVGQWFGKGTPRNIGDENCRELESAFNRPVGWMDNDHRLSQSARPNRDTLASAMKVLSYLARMQAGAAVFLTSADAILAAYDMVSRDPSQALDANLAGASERMAAQLRGEQSNEQAVERR